MTTVFEKEKWGKRGPKWVFQLLAKGQNMDSGIDPCTLGLRPALENWGGEGRGRWLSCRNEHTERGCEGKKRVLPGVSNSRERPFTGTCCKLWRI